MRLRLLALSLLFLVSLARSESAAPGESRFGTHRYIEYIGGDLPVVLTSPHGGTLRPTSLADRTRGVLEADANTQQLARAIADELLARTGHRPALIASHLHRRKLDPNREIVEAANGDPGAELAWKEFHAFVRAALSDAVARHGFAFLIDLHGHAHPIARVEIGYNLGAVQLAQDDAAFDRSDLATLSTLRDLHQRLGGSGAALLRGPRSLGALFAAQGVRAVPSPTEPNPGQNPFFSGGYIVQIHAAAPDTPKVDGVQFETPRPGIRDTPEHRAAFARATASVLATFLHERYGYDFPAVARPR